MFGTSYMLVILSRYTDIYKQDGDQTRFYRRVGKGIFVSREWSIFVRVKCEMLDFSVVKCDLFYSRDA